MSAYNYIRNKCQKAVRCWYFFPESSNPSSLIFFGSIDFSLLFIIYQNSFPDIIVHLSVCVFFNITSSVLSLGRGALELGSTGGVPTMAHTEHEVQSRLRVHRGTAGIR